MNLTTLDLNLLKVFSATMQEGSVTLAAYRLGLTQSAVSNALRRLRVQCNDPLFARTTQGMQPTAYAMELAPAVEQALALLRAAVERQGDFDAATSKRTFTLLMTDLGELAFLPGLVHHLQESAPGLALHIQQLPRERYRDALESGAADLAIGQLPTAHVDFLQQSLLQDSLLCLVRRDHPRIGDRMTLTQFLREQQVVIEQPAVVERIVTKALGKRAAERRIALRIPHYVVCPAIVAQSDLVAVIPQLVMRALTRDDRLKTVALPFRAPTMIVRQYWHRRANADPAHRWLRQRVASLFKA